MVHATGWTGDRSNARHRPSRLREQPAHDVSHPLFGGSEHFYRLLIERSPDAVFGTSEGRIRYANDAAVRLLGADRPEDLIDKPALDFLHEDCAERIVAYFRRAAEAGEPSTPQYAKVVRVDGTSLEVEVSVSPMLVDGVPQSVVIARDVSEREQAELETRRLNHALRTISECNGALVRAQSEQELLSEICRLLAEVGGYRLAWVGYALDDPAKSVKVVASAGPAVEYLSTFQVSWADDSPDGRGPAGSAIRTGSVQVVRSTQEDPAFSSWRERAGHFALHSAIAVPLHVSGRCIGSLLVYSDRTEVFDDAERALLVELGADLEYGISSLRSREESWSAQRAVEESARQWHLTFDSISDMVALLDAGGAVARSNASFARFLGKQAEDTVGRRCCDLMCDVDTAQCCVEVVRRTRRKAWHELSYNGRHLRVSIDPVIDEAGELVGMVHIATDVTDQKRAEAELGRMVERSEKAMTGVVGAMAQIVETRDPYTAGHQARVAELACAIGEKMGLPRTELDAIHLAAMVHDIGKIYVPAEILSKPGKLTEIEFALIRQHPTAGYEILKGIDFPWPIAQAVLEHQERYDGSGYPQGLSGEEICLAARMIAVADVVEAVASHRPYRPSLGIEAALDMIRSGRGTHFDPVVADACLELFTQHYTL